MENKIKILTISLLAIITLSNCSSLKEANVVRMQESMLAHFTTVNIERSPQQNFSDLQRGLETEIIPVQPANEISGSTYYLSGKSFFIAPIVQYVRAMGLCEKSINTDYKLLIKVSEAYVDMSHAMSSVSLAVSLQDEKGNEVFSQNNVSGKGWSSWPSKNFGLDNAYTNALEQINWNRIASFLRVEQLPTNEPYKQVQGDGNTALEQTIVRWDVQSRPQGADIFWRVISTTPEVKSTNNKYLMTTPYEATKSLDIRGLSYQTSGNVRIILRCEKEGYFPQEKEFNVRMVLDQEEISAFFKLIKENE